MLKHDVDIEMGALRHAVAKLTDAKVNTVDEFEVECLSGIPVASATAGLWRLSDGSGKDAWTLVLKVIRHSSEGHEYWMASQDADDPMYWRREALVYQDGLPKKLVGPLRGPDCLAIWYATDGSIQIFLEDAPGVPGTQWAVGDYRTAAHHYGMAQGRLPPAIDLGAPWLSRHWLEDYVDRRLPDMETPPPDIAWQQRLVRKAFPVSQARAVRRVWQRRKVTLSAVRQCPQTLCHLDTWPRNLFGYRYGTRAAETIAIDWAYCGIGALGEDMGNLVPDAMLDLFVDSRTDARTLHQNVLEGYLEGLEEAGWKGDPRQVEFVVNSTAALKYVWMLPRLLQLSRKPTALDALARSLGQPIDAIYEQRGATMRFLVELAELAEALRPGIS